MNNIENTHRCNYLTCASYAAYIRYPRNRWIRVGTYHTGCKSLTAIPEISLER